MVNLFEIQCSCFKTLAGYRSEEFCNFAGFSATLKLFVRNSTRSFASNNVWYLEGSLSVCTTNFGSNTVSNVLYPTIEIGPVVSVLLLHFYKTKTETT